MEIKVDPEEINKYIAKKIIESSIGPALEELINKNVQDLCKGYNNPVEPVVQRMIRDTVASLLQDKYADKIKDQVKKHLTDEFLEEMISKLWERFIKGY